MCNASLGSFVVVYVLGLFRLLTCGGGAFFVCLLGFFKAKLQNSDIKVLGEEAV